MSIATVILSGRGWLLPVIGALVMLAIVLVWTGGSGAAPGRVRWGCGLLKFAGVLVLGVCLLEPLWVGERARPGANYFAIVADNSQSLRAVKDSGVDISRAEIVRRSLGGGAAGGWQSVLEDTFQLRRYFFDLRLQSTRDYSELDFGGRATALGHALETMRERWRGQPVAGVLLFTDGNATDLAGELPALDGCPPVYAVMIGGDDGLRDMALDKVTVSQTAFEDAPVTVQAAVGAQGFAGTEVAARLVEIGAGGLAGAAGRTSPGLKIEQQRPVAGNDTVLNFRFQLQPRGHGIHFYELEVRARDELDRPGAASREVTLVNNRRMMVVDRGQEQMRVLYVGGRPDWEYKFLNRALQEDPQVRMVSLIRVARREPRFEFKGRPGEFSNPLYRGFDQQDEDTARYDQPVLIRLNAQDEFELRGGFPKTAEELFRYQAVIVDRVEAEFFTPSQLTLLHRFVSERGGGFLMLGGAESFREGNYAGTPVASLLPVYLDRPVAPLSAGEWKLGLTRDGWLQPWTRLRATEAEEETRLEAMPPFQVFNPVSEIKPGASVLATVAGPGGQSRPALAVQRFGLGRSAALTVGDLWRWGLRDESRQQDLAKSWRQLVRWLIADVPNRFTIVPDTAFSGNPAEIRLSVKARDTEYKPLEDAVVKLTVRPVRTADSHAATADLKNAQTNSVEITADPSASDPGTYEATYVAREAGAYAVEALVSGVDGGVVGRAAAAWVCNPEAEEFRSLKPNRTLLGTIARRTGGEMVELEDLDEFVRGLPEKRAPVTEPWSRPLWHRPGVFLFAIVCFVAEWGIRRWKGLP